MRLRRFLILLVFTILFMGVLEVNALTFRDDATLYVLEERNCDCVSDYIDSSYSLSGTIGDNFVFSDNSNEVYVKVVIDEKCTLLTPEEIIESKKSNEQNYSIIEGNNNEYWLVTKDDEQFVAGASKEFYDVTVNYSHSFIVNPDNNDVYVMVENGSHDSDSDSYKNNVYSLSGKLIFSDVDRFEFAHNSLYLVYVDGLTKIYNSKKELLTTIDYLFSVYEAGYSDYNSLLFGTDEEGDKSLLYDLRVYKVLEGNNQTFNNKDIVIKTTGNLSRLNEVLVNNKKLDNDDYSLKSGSTVITLKSEYLNTLPNGTYTLSLNYDDATLDATFKITNSSVVDNQISEVIITGFNKPVVGWAPKYTAKAIKDANYSVHMEGWMGNSKLNESSSSSNTLKTFEKNVNYMYSIYIKSKNNYVFADYVTVRIDDDIVLDSDSNCRLISNNSVNILACEYDYGKAIIMDDDALNPDTGDSIMTNIILGSVAFICLIGVTVYFKKVNAKEA